MSPFLNLTREFNAGALRAVVCSGQAVVLHRLAMMSKDGDWIVREEEESLAHIRSVLAAKGARYRFGAPLDARWLAGGWSAHLEFRQEDGLRVRTDFFSRPPRLSPDDLAALWQRCEKQDPPFTDARELVLMKMTLREKDYPIIGELARKLTTLEQQMLFSRSPRDLLRLCAEHPAEASKLAAQRTLLTLRDEDELAAALDAERRILMRADEQRLARYRLASSNWEAAWPKVESSSKGLPLEAAHRNLCDAAAISLPYSP